jgi:hypothetical protein
MLGVRRTTVTTLVQGLKTKGVIKSKRGRVTIVDRNGLEACACAAKPDLVWFARGTTSSNFAPHPARKNTLRVWYRSESASRAGVDGCTAPDRSGLQFPNLLSIRKFGLDRPHHHAHSFLAARASISTLVKITVLVGGPGGNDAQAGAAAGGTDTYHAGTLDRLEVVSSRHDIAPANLSVRTSGLRWS